MNDYQRTNPYDSHVANHNYMKKKFNADRDIMNRSFQMAMGKFDESEISRSMRSTNSSMKTFIQNSQSVHQDYSPKYKYSSSYVERTNSRETTPRNNFDSPTRSSYTIKNTTPSRSSLSNSAIVETTIRNFDSAIASFKGELDALDNIIKENSITPATPNPSVRMNQGTNSSGNAVNRFHSLNSPY